MKRSKRMKPIVGVESSREREAARALGEAQAALRHAEARLAELRGYRDEYAERFEQSGQAGLTATALLGYRRFLTQLNQAIDHQGRVIEQAREAVRRRIEAWQAARSRLQAVEKVVEKLRREEEAAEERREQNESDERGQRYRG